ncbi:hypothetical protein [Chryseobacterium luteum]|nr:hypothetical protein [Chryseobacterium luteum]
MVGNFKYLALFALFLSCFSCQNRERKVQLANELITENLSVLLDNLDYFNISNDSLTVGVYQYVGEIKSDQKIVIEKFQNKFNLNDEKIFNEYIKIEKIPKKIGNYSLFLDTDNTFQKRNNIVKVSFVNFIISRNNQYASVEVIKSLGNGTKFEIYYFKQIDGKWVFDSKELIGLG